MSAEKVSDIKDPLLDQAAVLDRFHEHGLAHMTANSVKNLWDTNKLPRAVISKKRYTRRSAVDKWVSKMAKRAG